MNKIRLNAVGDVMFGDFPLTLGFGVRSTLKNASIQSPFDKITNILKDSDICFGNLETVLSNHGLREKNIQSTQMRGDSSFALLLKDAGFTVMSLANNHAMQHGPEAFKETESVLAQNGIASIGGIGKNFKSTPFFIEKSGIHVCFLGYSLRPEKYCSPALYSQPSIQEIIEDVRQNKPKCDVVIVSLHWGDEFVRVPSPEQIFNAHSIIEAGASLVLGHHPHIIQGIEQYKEGLIVYSLGNFVFDFWQNKFRETFIFHCELTNKGVESFSITPIFIDKLYRPTVLTGTAASCLLKKIHKLSSKIQVINIGCEKQLKKYILNVKLALLVNKIENRLFFIKNIFKYERWVVIQSIKNFLTS